MASRVSSRLGSSGWAMLEYGWYPLLVFVGTPWFLHRLGTEPYGLWMLIAATVGLGGILNSGTGTAVIKTVSVGVGRADSPLVSRAVGTALAIAIAAGGALAVVVFGIFWVAGDQVFARMSDPGSLKLAGGVAALLIWLEQMDNVFSSALKGAERFAQAAALEIACKTLLIAGASAVLYWWPSLAALYTALLFFTLVRLVVKARAARSALALGSLSPGVAGLDEVLHLVKWGWLQGVGGMLFAVADRFLVGALLGASSLAYYSIATQLAMQIHAATAAAVSVIFPRISRLLESGQVSRAKSTMAFAFLGSLLLGSLLASALFWFGPPLLTAWVGPEVAAPTASILPWLIAAFWILTLNIVPYYSLLGMGRVRFIGICVLVAGGLSAVVMYASITRLGIIGAPVGRGVYALLTLVLALPFLLHLIRRRTGGGRTGPPGDAGMNDAKP